MEESIARVYGTRVLPQQVEKLTGEIDQARRDISAWKHWLNEWAPRLRQLWRDSSPEGGQTQFLAELLVTVRQLEAHAQVTVGRLEEIESAFAEWNGWAMGLSNRIDRAEEELKALKALLPQSGELLPGWLDTLVARLQRLEVAAGFLPSSMDPALPK